MASTATTNQAEATKPKRKATRRTGRADNSNDTKKIADELKLFIEHNKLAKDIQGKQFVNVEAWQYAASRLGYVVIQDKDSLVDCSVDGEIKYKAFAYLYHLETGTTSGGGFGMCSNKESGKKFYQEFAIASMAQTRAVSKAVRMTFAYLIVAAGFEATPVEEMEYSNPPAAPAAQPQALLASSTPAAGQAALAEPATDEQRDEIRQLCAHPLITRQEKEKMLEGIMRLDYQRAAEAVAKMRRAIEDREGTSAVAA